MVLSEVTLRVLREYLKAYQPKNWLFPGPKQNSHLTTRTVEKILEVNDNKKLQFEASPRVVHKRSTSVILS